jgi:hypothetical protein
MGIIQSRFRFLKLFFWVVFFTLLLLVLSGDTVNALVVSPPQYDVNLDPGQTISGSFEVYNNDDKPANLKIRAYNVEFVGETASPEIDFGDNPDQNTIASWISMTPETAYLDVDRKQTVNYTLSVPYDAPVGTHIALGGVREIERIDEDGQEDVNVGIGKFIGMLFVVNVQGDNTQEPEFVSFDLVNSFNFFGLRFLDVYPAEFETRLKNNGNTYYMPRGTVVLRDSERSSVMSDMRLNNSNHRVLPGKTRLYKNTYVQDPKSFDEYMKNPNALTAISYYLANMNVGVFNAEMSVDTHIKEGGPVVYNRQFNYIVFPFRLVLVVIMLIALILIIRKIRKNLQEDQKAKKK